MITLLRTLLMIVLLAMLGNSFALPACSGTESAKWNNCFGSWTYKGDKYLGEFKDGKYHGQGTYTWANGVRYVGEFNNSHKNGKGNQTHPDGSSYVGDFKGDKFHGRGTYTWSDGQKYVGDFKDDKQNGKGMKTFPDGSSYEGEIKDNKYYGHGTFTWPDGAKYVGGFVNGKRKGKGTLTNLDGSTYSGDFEYDTFYGRGTYTWPNGQKYVGEFKDGKSYGMGTEIYADGSSYVGEFKDNEYHGQGTRTFANGDKYIGEYENGVASGLGIEYRDDGTIAQAGVFKFGVLIAEQYVDINSFSRIARSAVKPATTDVARTEVELKAAQLEEERIRLAKEREQLNAEKLQREREEQLELAQNAPSPVAVQSTKRIALVIGNASYSTRPLKNPRNDADDISRALKTANFDVIDLRDATLSQMRSAVRQFGDKLLNNDVGLVYYSGHGVEVKGKNYFLAINADIQREDEIADQGLDVALILEKMTTAGKGVNILIVDACRDDPFGRSFRSSSKGLATMDAPRGTIIAYSTSPGKVASDGDPKARNSPYTKALLQAMQAPNRPIEQVFKDVRRSVQAETKDQQTPWENTSLSGDFYFRVQR